MLHPTRMKSNSMTNGNTSDKQYIFIGGLHRSGTSLLHRILASHPDITGFHNTGVPEDEGQHLQSVFPAANKFGGPGKFCFDSGSVMNEDSQLIKQKEETKHLLLEQWEKWWDISKPIRIEKSPPNLIRSRFFQSLFGKENTKFIFITRHPITVSLATQKWSKTSLNELIDHWCTGYRLMLSDLKHIHNWHLVRYEDLILTPDIVLQKLYDFLSLANNTTTTEDIWIDGNKNYFEQWQTQLSDTPDIVKDISCFSEDMIPFGYQVTPPFVTTALSTNTLLAKHIK